MTQLLELHLQGFKSIRDQKIRLGRLNLLIGANGSGKSNLISFFRMLNAMFAKQGDKLSGFVGDFGGGSALLFNGPQETAQMVTSLIYQDQDATLKNGYEFTLKHGAGDTLYFSKERVWLQREGFRAPIERSHEYEVPASDKDTRDLGSGQRESMLPSAFEEKDSREARVARFAVGFMSSCRVYHFHDTSAKAPIRNASATHLDSFLLPNGENLAVFLWRMREDRKEYYDRIIRVIRRIAPFFNDFELEPNPYSKTLMLNWRSMSTNYTFGPHQLSDGTLRAIALFTLLLQPPDTRPSALILDEPELGLHPFALQVLWELIEEASDSVQLLVATQSSQMLSLAQPGDVLVTEHRDGASEFKRLNTQELEFWLKDYTLDELWNKNVLGGRPSR